MSKVKVSTKYQVVIPKETREKLGIKKGQTLVILEKNGLAYIVPQKPVSSFGGAFPRLSLDNLRDKKDRF